MEDNEILRKYNKTLPSLILNHYHILIPAYIIVLIAFGFTDYYIRKIPELILTRIAPVTLGVFLLIIKFTHLKQKELLVKTANNLFCISALMMGFTILIITFNTPIFKSSISAIIMITVTVYFLVKGKKSVITVFSIPLVFILFYLLFIIQPSIDKAQELMNPFAFYLGAFLVSYFTEKSRIKEFGLVTRLKHEQEKTRQLLLDKELQNKEIETSRDQLKILNANKDRFFSILAHDLRNPMATFLSHTDFLVENYKAYSEEEKINVFKSINKSTTRIYTLLDNLLKWSRLQIKNISFNPEKISITEITEKTVDILAEQTKTKNISIKLKIENNLFCYADKNMINSTLKNLVSNAIKFSFEKSEITITATSLNQFIKISVADHGTGISKEDQEKLFKIEKYISTPGTNKEEGTGLGLILCKEFTEKNGGEINVDSNSNKGSVFSFTIPKA